MLHWVNILFSSLCMTIHSACTNSIFWNVSLFILLAFDFQDSSRTYFSSPMLFSPRRRGFQLVNLKRVVKSYFLLPIDQSTLNLMQLDNVLYLVWLLMSSGKHKLEMQYFLHLATAAVFKIAYFSVLFTTQLVTMYCDDCIDDHLISVNFSKTMIHG